MSNDKGEIWVKMPKNEEIEWEKGEFDVGNVRSRLSKRVSRLGNIRSMVGSVHSMVGSVRSMLGNVRSMLRKRVSRLGNIRSMVGSVHSMLGNVRSRLSKRVSRLGSVEISRRRREIHRRSGISSSRNVKGRLNGRPYFFAAKSQRGLSGQVSQDGLRGRQIVRPSTRMFK